MTSSSVIVEFPTALNATIQCWPWTVPTFGALVWCRNLRHCVKCPTLIRFIDRYPESIFPQVSNTDLKQMSHNFKVSFDFYLRWKAHISLFEKAVRNASSWSSHRLSLWLLDIARSSGDDLAENISGSWNVTDLSADTDWWVTHAIKSNRNTRFMTSIWTPKQDWIFRWLWTLLYFIVISLKDSEAFL